MLRTNIRMLMAFVAAVTGASGSTSGIGGNIDYRYKSIRITAIASEFLRATGTFRAEDGFKSFSNTKNADICSALWISRGLFSHQPKERFSLSLGQWSQEPKITTKALSEFFSFRLREEYGSVTAEEVKLGDRSWMLFEARPSSISHRVEAIIYTSVLDDSTYIVARVVAVSGEDIRERHLTNFRKALEDFVSSIRVSED